MKTIVYNNKIERIVTDGHDDDYPEIRFAVMLANHVMGWLNTSARGYVVSAIEMLRARKIAEAVYFATFAYEDRLMANLGIGRDTIATAAGRPLDYLQVVRGVSKGERHLARLVIERAVDKDTTAQRLWDLLETIRTGTPYIDGEPDHT